MCGIHYESGGSPDGLALAQEFSSRSAKHDRTFLEPAWPYIRSDRGVVITGGTICLMARERGWKEPNLLTAVTPALTLEQVQRETARVARGPGAAGVEAVCRRAIQGRHGSLDRRGLPSDRRNATHAEGRSARLQGQAARSGADVELQARVGDCELIEYLPEKENRQAIELEQLILAKASPGSYVQFAASSPR